MGDSLNKGMGPSQQEFFKFMALVTFSATTVIHSSAWAFSTPRSLPSCPHFAHSDACVGRDRFQGAPCRLQGQNVEGTVTVNHRHGPEKELTELLNEALKFRVCMTLVGAAGTLLLCLQESGAGAGVKPFGRKEEFPRAGGRPLGRSSLFSLWLLWSGILDGRTRPGSPRDVGLFDYRTVGPLAKV